MKTLIKIDPKDFLLVHRLAVAFDIVLPYNEDNLETIRKRNPGWLYIQDDYNKATFSWDNTDFQGNNNEDFIDLIDFSTHSMVLDGQTEQLSAQTYRKIKELISCE